VWPFLVTVTGGERLGVVNEQSHLHRTGIEGQGRGRAEGQQQSVVSGQWSVVSGLRNGLTAAANNKRAHAHAWAVVEMEVAAAATAVQRQQRAAAAPRRHLHHLAHEGQRPAVALPRRQRALHGTKGHQLALELLAGGHLRARRAAGGGRRAAGVAAEVAEHQSATR
jgi:hypothetical protein